MGTVSGAGAGAVTQLVTWGKIVHVPAEPTLTFRLEKHWFSSGGNEKMWDLLLRQFLLIRNLRA